MQLIKSLVTFSLVFVAGLGGSLARSGEAADTGDYILGPEDGLSIRVVDAEEVASAPYVIDLRGNLDLPRVGRIHASGLTVPQLQSELARRFREFLQHPMVSVSVAEFRSQPVSVLGEVKSPGVHQIRGHKTLFEVISEAGGLTSDAGNSIKLARRKEWGPIPLPGTTTDSSGEFSIATVSVHTIMTAQNPDQNVAVKPNDVITVPRADLVYVIGAVNRAGGFVLYEKSSLSVLEALSMAQGLQNTAAQASSKILRCTNSSTSRTEIPINLKRIMGGKQPDVPLLANDILFVPTSAAKSASLRAVEALVQTGTGIMIYGRPY